MAVVENAAINSGSSNRTDAHAPADVDQSKSNHGNGNGILRPDDQNFHVVVHHQPPPANGSVVNDGGEGFKREMRDLEEMLSKLNPMAEEFVPPSLGSHRPPPLQLQPPMGGLFGFTNGFDSFVIQTNSGVANGNIARRVYIYIYSYPVSLLLVANC